MKMANFTLWNLTGMIFREKNKKLSSSNATWMKLTLGIQDMLLMQAMLSSKTSLVLLKYSEANQIMIIWSMKA